jgi:hypothetical protein
MKRKEVERFLRNLEARAELNYNPGRVVYTKIKRSKKDRRNSGRREGRLHGFPLGYLRENCLEHFEFWDNWFDWRDGMRNYWIMEYKKIEKERSNKRKV